jgi:hypothetical protein
VLTRSVCDNHTRQYYVEYYDPLDFQYENTTNTINQTGNLSALRSYENGFSPGAQVGRKELHRSSGTRN